MQHDLVLRVRKGAEHAALLVGGVGEQGEGLIGVGRDDCGVEPARLAVVAGQLDAVGVATK